MRFVCDSCQAQYMISDEKVGPKGAKVRCKKCGQVIVVQRPSEDVPPPTEQTEAAAPPAPESEGGDWESEATQLMSNPLQAMEALARAQAEEEAGREASVQVDPEVTNPGDGGGASPPENALFGAVKEDEIGMVFDQALSAEPKAAPSRGADDEPTVAGGGVALGDDEEDRMSTRVLEPGMMRKLAEDASLSADLPKAEALAPKAAPKVPEDDWFVAINDNQVGPLTLGKLKDLWERGEITPDSLCWRAGFADWIALSEVTDLASVLAPMPAKPVMVAQPRSSQSFATMPVESAFSAGGVSRVVRSEVPVAASAASDGEEISWKPSAASALASLVKEEIEALTKPAPKPAPPISDVPSSPGVPAVAPAQGEAPAAAVKGLLDVPEVTPVNGRALGQLPAERPTVRGSSGERRPREDVSASYSYRPPPAAGLPKNVLYGLVGGVVLLVLLLVGAVIFALMRTPPGPVQVPQPAPAALVAEAETSSKQPKKGKKGKEVEPPAEAAPKTDAPQPSPADAEKPEAPPTAVAEAAPAAPPAKTEPSKVSEATQAKPQEAGAREPAGTRSTRARSESTPSKSESPPAAVAVAPSREPPSPEDEFDKEFGGGGSKVTPSAPAGPKSSSESVKKKPSNVYVPPAPGGQSNENLPASLSQSDIMSVVLANKPGIMACVSEQKKKDPSVTGPLVMRWTIQTSGKTSNVKVQTTELRDTAVATCLGNLIKTFKFPAHQKEGDPVDFPFRW